MSKNTIKIDGAKLKELLTTTTGKSLGDIAVENGFSRSLLNESVRTGKASPIIQSIAKLYGITPEAYAYKDPEPTPTPAKEPGQVSFSDLGYISGITKDDIKAAILEAMAEITPDFAKILSTAINEAVKSACFEAVEENIPYIMAEVGKSQKGNIKAAMRETLISFGWALKDKDGGKR